MLINRNKKIPRIIVFTDDKCILSPIELAKVIPINWGILIRNYQAPNRKELICSAAKICKQRGIFFIIANDLKLALSLKASGLHLSEYHFSRNILSTIFIHSSKLQITTSAHTFHKITQSNLYKFDAIFLSPIFKTQSHPTQSGLGIHRFIALSKKTSVNTLALGGIRLDDYNRLSNFGLYGIGGISIAKLLSQNFNLTPKRAPFWGASICETVLSRSK
ncbi:MAG: thiamine phosphate synthase [Pseudomonadota bacterium]|nr:thiamine phosphate synthase [Pseudomonadota bacterium]